MKQHEQPEWLAGLVYRLAKPLVRAGLRLRMAEVRWTGHSAAHRMGRWLAGAGLTVVNVCAEAVGWLGTQQWRGGPPVSA